MNFKDIGGRAAIAKVFVADRILFCHVARRIQLVHRQNIETYKKVLCMPA